MCGVTQSTIDSVRESVLTAISDQSRDEISGDWEREYEIVRNEPSWFDLVQVNALMINYFDPTSMKAIVNGVALKADIPKKIVIQVANQPFDCGKMI